MQLDEATEVGVWAGDSEIRYPAPLGTYIRRRIANGEITKDIIIALAHFELEGDWVALVIKSAAAIDVARQSNRGTVKLSAREPIDAAAELVTRSQHRAVGSRVAV